MGKGNRCKQGIVRDNQGGFNVQKVAGVNEPIKTFGNTATQARFCNNACPDRETCTSDCKGKILETFQRKIEKVAY